MEIQAARLRARTGPKGEPILLLFQNRGLWDQLLIRRGLAALERAGALPGACGGRAFPGRGAESCRRGRDGVRPGGRPELVDALTSEPSFRAYHLLPSVRGDLLAKLGRFAEAGVEFKRAAARTRNARERELLLERAQASPAGIAQNLSR
jgi:predicted RNA polymerase sigma factor